MNLCVSSAPSATGFSFLSKPPNEPEQASSETSEAPPSFHQRARELEAQGYRVWYATIFGQAFVDAWEWYHEEAIKWHWESRQALIRGEPIPYDAYLAVWSRKWMKSTAARRVAVADACLSASAEVPGYCLYLGGSKGKTDDHALSVGKLLQRPTLREYYPPVVAISRNERGFSEGGRQEFRYSESGYVFRFASLDAGLAGANVDDTRPTLIIPDDVDERNCSAEVYTSRANRFTSEVLPTRQQNTLVFGAQNVIQRGTIFHQIHTGQLRALMNRFPSKAIPAVEGLEYEDRVVDGRPRTVITAGKSTWKAWTMAQIQNEVDLVTIETFELEYQHNVDKRKTGLVLDRYDPAVHLITWSEFARVFGVRHIPNHWEKYVGHDWGNTHPNVTSVVTVSAQNSALPGIKFLCTGLTAKQQSTVDDVALAFIERLMPGIDTSAVRSVTGEDYNKWIGGQFGQVLNAPREIAKERLLPQVQDWLMRHPEWRLWVMSHEQANNRDIYNAVYGLPFEACNPGASGGVSEINAALTVDYKAAHPFRPGARGYAGFYFIVDDDQFVVHDTGIEGGRDDRGLKLWRDQIPLWNWRETKVTSSGLSDDKPAKVNDDAGNSLMMIFSRIGALQPAPLSSEEEVERRLAHAKKSEEEIAEMSDDKQRGYFMRLARERYEVEQQMENENLSDYQRFIQEGE